MANSQHRCVFVGNIPYDATEEQLVQICEEVGPVVSFRLVIDRETGKPKGYGFCEYKDEETALSARRNLHGYDINGRQLRVDFAENDKNNDKSREQGRGGPGPSTTTAPQKQIGGPAIQGDPSLHQPIGLQVAMAAAVVMAGTPGGGNITQNGLQSQPILGTDPLTLHLAKIPKNQLIEVLTEVKAMATQNKEQARQLLLAHPQLSKAVLQAHIMLKTVPPHMMPNAQQFTGPNPLVQSGPVAQPSSIQPLSGLPPLAQTKVQLGPIPQSHIQPSSSHPASLGPSQYAAAPLLPPEARFQTPPPAQRHVLQQSTLSGLQLLHSQRNAGLLNQVENHIATPSSLLQYPGQNVAAGPVQPSIPNHHKVPILPSSSVVSAIANNGNKDHNNPQHLIHNPAWGYKVDHHPNVGSRLHDKDQIGHPSKLLKMEDGRGSSYSPACVNLSASVSGSSQAVSLSGNQILKAGAIDSQNPNPELPAGIESALLQQVLTLTPEQLSSLPPEQQQQVIQLQQMLRQST
ncbi:cleavage stimulating factor 64-like isoform X2 [Rutidosis leptorrhynchoides]|uniref:cleavage stimulating factor 64-like isoform X2 n=1 Tax=Rutidosis leptorrhynchoides TaxID=125765 RepID=UPI003A990ADF